MSFEEVTSLLQRYESLARERGVVAIDYLRPGITAEAIAELEQRFGFRLSEDVKAVWSWHDGMGKVPVGVSNRRIGAAWDFTDLATSLEAGQQLLAMLNNVLDDRYLFSRWVILGHSSVNSVIEISNSTLPDSYVLVADVTQSVLNYPIVTVAQKIGWFIWAIEEGAWYVGDDGSWKVDFDRYPKNGMKDLL